MKLENLPDGTVDSVDFAKYIILRVQEAGKSLDKPLDIGETKLQKLLYICDGFILAAGINFIGEVAKAWNYGPVYPRVHKWLSKDTDAFAVPRECPPPVLEKIKSINAKPLVDKVISVYGPKSAGELSAWSHRPGSPWEKALERGKGIMNSPIDKGDMKRYFQGFLGDNF
jgi:uncharacterized phage-associated protein